MISEILYEQQGVSDTEGEVIKLFFDDYSWVEAGEVVVEIETSKTAVEILVESDGYIKNIAKLNEIIKVGDVLVVIGESIDEIKAKTSDLEGRFDSQEIKQKTISAKALKIAKSANIDLQTLERLKITSVEEINTYLEDNVGKKGSSINQDFLGKFQQATLSKSKSSEIESLRLAQTQTLPCTCSIIIENFNIDIFSKENNLYFDNVFPVVAKICANELKTVKNLNGFFHDNKKYCYEDINIGFTIDVQGCAQVAVVHNCDKLNKDEIQRVFFDLVTASVRQKMTPSQMSKPTFVISDLSSIGSCFFHTPLLAPFTAGILGLAIDKEASRLVLTLTYDHQMSAGKEALLFLEKIRSKLSTKAT